MIRSIRTNTARILTTLPAILTFAILLGLVLYNFVIQVLTNAEIREASQMNDPLVMLTLSDYSSHSLGAGEGGPVSLANEYLMLIYPALVAFPVVSLWISDRGSGMVNYLDARSGRKAFWFGKLTAVFLSTFIIFTLPFLLEILLGLISFPASAKGLPGVDYSYQETEVKLFFLPELWTTSRLLYVILMTLLFGIVSGILACFGFACSTLPFMRFRVLNFLPVVAVLYGGILLGQTFCKGTMLNYMYLLRMYWLMYQRKFPIPLYVGILTGLALISVGLIFYRSRKDQLS